MRVSTVVGDPGYVSPPRVGKYEILLDGILQSPEDSGRAIITADDAEGIIVFHERASMQGPPYLMKNDGQNFLTFEMKGRVEIRVRD